MVTTVFAVGSVDSRVPALKQGASVIHRPLHDIVVVLKDVFCKSQVYSVKSLMSAD